MQEQMRELPDLVTYAGFAVLTLAALTGALVADSLGVRLLWLVVAACAAGATWSEYSRRSRRLTRDRYQPYPSDGS